jgi:hypothetical protein
MIEELHEEALVGHQAQVEGSRVVPLGPPY